MDDHQFRRLLDRFGLSWKGYRRVRKGVKKRIHRQMQEVECGSFEAFLHAIGEDPVLKARCELLLTVSISRFFRDKALWHALECSILFNLLRRSKENVRAWSAGCACGEEVYSLRILWEEFRKNWDGPLPRLEILATDMNPLYLDRAKAGIYPRSSLKEIPGELRSAYMVQKNGGRCYEVKPSLKSEVLWEEHNLLGDSPGPVFDLIFLRNNLLTYYRNEIARPAFLKLVKSLAVGGYLFIGSHEKLPMDLPGLAPLKGFSYIFQKQDSAG